MALGCLWAPQARAQPWSSSEPFGLEDLWSNYVALADLDADGDLDVVFANATGFLTTPTAQPLRRYRNTGGTFRRDDLRSGGPSLAARQVALGDIDGDGDLDLYAPDGRGDSAGLLLRNDGRGSFEDASEGLPDVAPNAGFARFGDVDGDGDLDLFVGQGYADPAPRPLALLLLGDGTGHFVDASERLPTQAEAVGAVDIDLLDVDGDFDLDALLNVPQGGLWLWVNDGFGRFESIRLPGLGSGFHYGPAVCDVDGDGDLDVWVDNLGPSFTEQLLINDGAGGFSDETARRVTGNPAADDASLACVDVDDDGDFDLVVAAIRPGGERVLLNDGTGHFTERVSAFFPDPDTSLWVAAGDMNGDGRVDFVTAQGETGDSINRLYLADTTVPVDATPPVLRAVQPVGAEVPATAPLVLRFAVSDREVTDHGPRLREAYVELVGEAPVPAVFVGGDLFMARLDVAERIGETLALRYCATDLRGATACSEVRSTRVVEEPSSPDGGTDGGSGRHDGGLRRDGGRRDGGRRDAAPRDGSGSIDAGFLGVPSEDGGCRCSAGRRRCSLPLALIAFMAFRRRRHG